ncbi:MAG: hypothetical protein ACJAYU_002813 [Bradymonadia bacterium]
MSGDSPNALRALVDQMRELTRVTLWVVTASRRFRGQIMRVVLLDMVSLAGWFGALAGFVELLRALEFDADFTLGPISMSVSGPVEVMGVCALLAVLGGFGALCNYAARKGSAGAAGSLLADLRRRLLTALTGPNQQWRTLVSGPPRKWLRPLAAKDAAMTALALWSLLNTLLPAGIAILVAGYMLVLDPLLSAMLVPLLIPYLAALSLAYARVATARRKYLELSPNAVGGIVDALSALVAEDGAHEANFQAALERIEGPEHRESVTLFFELRLVTQRVKMINGVFLVVCLGAVLSFYVPLIEDTERTWADPVVYVIGLRLLLLAAQKVSGGLAMVSRRLPEISSLSHFLDLSQSTTEVLAGNRNSQLFSSASDDLEGDL